MKFENTQLKKVEKSCRISQTIMVVHFSYTQKKKKSVAIKERYIKR